jgi:hypothetical protein
MIDGIETVDERYLIPYLNISTPYSSTDGDIRYDLPLVKATYKGIHIFGRNRIKKVSGRRYTFDVRGSLIKLANNGAHNNSFKDPFEILYALDDLVTNLRIDPFKTPLNGMELSATIDVGDPEIICSSIVSYLNHPPNQKTIKREGVRLKYVEVEAGQHKLKMYMPTAGSLRVEVKVDRMLFLGANSPKTLAELVQLQFSSLFAEKLLNAFNKIIWKCPGIDLNTLSSTDRDLYLRGQDYNYCQINRKSQTNRIEFKRIEKQRSREKSSYKELVQRHWVHHPPTEIQRRLLEQLKNYSDLMHSDLYKTMLKICLKRWKYICQNPFVDRLPKHLKLPELSEIYPLYLNRFPTAPSRPHQQPTDWWLSSSLAGRSGSEDSKVTKRHVMKSDSYQLARASKPFITELRRIVRAVTRPGRIQYALEEIESLLSVRGLIGLALQKQSIRKIIFDSLLRKFSPSSSV